MELSKSEEAVYKNFEPEEIKKFFEDIIETYLSFMKICALPKEDNRIQISAIADLLTIFAE